MEEGKEGKSEFSPLRTPPSTSSSFRPLLPLFLPVNCFSFPSFPPSSFPTIANTKCDSAEKRGGGEREGREPGGHIRKWNSSLGAPPF